jgi:hypothetical protein
MALKEQDVVLYSTDADGNKVIQMPITRIENVEGLGESLKQAIPTGFVLPFAANSAPDGFLLCNGAEVSRTTYSTLFAKIGTTYGVGNSSTTFNLPNLTDRVIQGNSSSGTYRNAGLPNITGSFGGIRDVGTYPEGAFFDDGRTSLGSPSGRDSRLINFSASRSNSIYGASTTVQPPALTMRYYIKY